MNVEMLLVAGLAVLIAIMILGVRWARRRTTGALMFGAILSLLAPDPTLEQKIRLAEEAREERGEEEGKGEPKG